MELFIDTGYARLFEMGDPSVLVGHSGVELGEMVLEKAGREVLEYNPRFYRSKDYWAGWALAYYEWYSSLSFKEILSKVSMSDIENLYYPYHEMDITSFCEEMSRLIKNRSNGSRLKGQRLEFHMTQKRLSEESGVSKRLIEQYEAGTRSLRKASAESVIALSKSLHCNPEDILEYL